MELGEDAEAWRFANEIPAGSDEMRSIAFDTLSFELTNIGKPEKARQALQEVTDTTDRNRLIARIEEIEGYKKRLKEAKTAKQRDAIRAQLRDEGVRQPGPLRFKDTGTAWRLRNFTPGQNDADVWASFGNIADVWPATKDFRKFVRELRGESKYVLSTAILGVERMMDRLREYRQIEERQRKRRQSAVTRQPQRNSAL